MARLKLLVATADDAEDISALRNAVADHLTEQHGKGAWSGHGTARGVLAGMRHGKVYVARERGQVIASLALVERKPWAIDKRYFTPVRKPLYLLSMNVAPAFQRRGIGRGCLDAVLPIAAAWPADSVCLDAFAHAAAGAAPFYARCGYRETGRVTYRGVPLVYFERLVPQER